MVLTTTLIPYQPALLVVAALALIVLVQALLTAPFAYAPGEQAPGATLQGDHSLRSFRVVRTHANSAENLAPLGLVVLLAALVGANATVVNWAAGAHLFFRLAFWAVYFAGVGAVAGGPRSLCFLGGLIANGIIVVAVVLSLTTGELS